MAVFTSTIPNLITEGPIIEIMISQTLTFLRPNPDREQKIFSLSALIDTGASSSFISKGVIQYLGIKPVGSILVNTPTSTNFECLQFDIQVNFPNLYNIPSIIISEAPLEGQNIKFIIGRDILSKGLLVYSGFNNTFTLAF